MKEDDESQVTMGGKKKSNGHKANCTCPICVNMKGSKKANGHKANCKCSICKNMKGGSMSPFNPANFVGGKKANGHKATCKCPICVNMKHQKASKKNRRVKRSKRTRRGGRMIPPSVTPTEVEAGDDYAMIPPDNNNVAPDMDDSFDEGNLAGMNDVQDDERQPGDNANVGNRLFGDDDNDDPAQGGKKKRKSNGHKANCKCPICKNMKMKKGGAADDDSSDSDSDSSSNSDSSSDSDSDTTTDAAMGGGKKKRKGNGHKANCKCPICKNMKKGGVKSPYPDQDPDNVPTDPRQANGALVEAEMGQSKFGKENTKPEQTTSTSTKAKVDFGGSRRRRKSRKTRKSRNTRKIRRRR
jgi:clumping factor A